MSTHESPRYDKPEYTVRIRDRIDALAFATNQEVGPDDSFSYTWNGGYEVLNLEANERHGGFEYRGCYHPDDGFCIGPGVCRYCGRTMFDD